jgi:hypothetical protein
MAPMQSTKKRKTEETHTKVTKASPNRCSVPKSPLSILATSKRRLKTPASFLSLPSEIRQSIPFYAFYQLGIMKVSGGLTKSWVKMDTSANVRLFLGWGLSAGFTRVLLRM